MLRFTAALVGGAPLSDGACAAPPPSAASGDTFSETATFMSHLGMSGLDEDDILAQVMAQSQQVRMGQYSQSIY